MRLNLCVALVKVLVKIVRICLLMLCMTVTRLVWDCPRLLIRLARKCSCLLSVVNLLSVKGPIWFNRVSRCLVACRCCLRIFWLHVVGLVLAASGLLGLMIGGIGIRGLHLRMRVLDLTLNLLTVWPLTRLTCSCRLVWVILL